MIDIVVSADRANTNGNTLVIRLPDTTITYLVGRLLEKSRGGRLSLKLGKWYKPRTTGPDSQSAHLHGHLQQLAMETGHTMQELKEFMKADLPQWPTHVIKLNGKTQIIYESEAAVNTAIEAAAIEWCHIQAADLGIRLIEEASYGSHA